MKEHLPFLFSVFSLLIFSYLYTEYSLMCIHFYRVMWDPIIPLLKSNIGIMLEKSFFPFWIENCWKIKRLSNVAKEGYGYFNGSVCMPRLELLEKHKNSERKRLYSGNCLQHLVSSYIFAHKLLNSVQLNYVTLDVYKIVMSGFLIFTIFGLVAMQP